MTYLIDTNALLWALGDTSFLSRESQSVLLDSENIVQTSVVSLWEIAIKMSIDKLRLGKSFDEIIYEIEGPGFNILPISLEALKQVRDLPFFHRDPFDRLIIAQAQVAKSPIITKDSTSELYDVEVIW